MLRSCVLVYVKNWEIFDRSRIGNIVWTLKGLDYEKKNNFNYSLLNAKDEKSSSSHIIWFSCNGVTHVACLGQEWLGGSHPSLIAGLNSEVPFPRLIAITRLKSPICPCYLPIAEEMIVQFISFQRVLALWEMQTALFKIWIQEAESTTYNDNRYATSTSNSYYRMQKMACL